MRFTFMLALRLGMVRGEMLRRMDSRELSDWNEYFLVLQSESDEKDGISRG